jgi:PAS domain S-box-containing protein
MNRRSAWVVGLVVAAVIALHVALYQHMAARVTAVAREPTTGEDRARDVRLLMQVPIFLDLGIVCGLVVWAAVRKRELDGLRELRGRYASLRKAVEKERSLAGMESRLRATLEHAPLAMLLLDDEGRLLYANRRAVELTGLDRQQLHEARFADLLAPQAVVGFADLRRTLESRSPQAINVTLRSPAGIAIGVRAHLSLLPREATEQPLIAAFLELAAAAASGQPLAAECRARNVVLAADDEEIIRVLLRDMLQHMGYQPLVARDGQEALELFAQHRPRIAAVVLDVVMPRLGGEEAAAAIQAIAPGTPVLLCSGLTQLPAAAPQDLRDRLLRKPFRYEDLQLALQTVISAASDAATPSST